MQGYINAVLRLSGPTLRGEEFYSLLFLIFAYELLFSIKRSHFNCDLINSY